MSLKRQPAICLVLALVLTPLSFSLRVDAQQATNASRIGVSVPAGFEIVQVAGDELATNVYCIAVSPNGETFVSGPGYINVLVDSDGDHVFDSARRFANGPQSGAQGMCFDGTDLLCTGDGGLLRFVDANGDGVADGPPAKIFSIKTGGEHDAHAIRQGPDGWWYLLAGNGTPILPEYFAGKHSPVKQPRAGFLMRISPDWTEKEIFAHGFRNAYDFDFNSLGQVFVYDSDGERDISLPWYRPTRVYRIRPGDDAGWLAAGWKRPSYFFDMPPEVGALGRGSPTGVIGCSSKSFPSSFQDAIFVADWTFGRVIAFRRDVSRETYDRGSDFAIANGQFGFAVTDLDFDSEGSLLISTGGRGTQGAIYRVSYVGQDRPNRQSVLSPVQAFILESNSKRLDQHALLEALQSPRVEVQTAALESLVGRQDILSPSGGLNESQELGIIRGLRKVFSNADSKTFGLALRVASELNPMTRGKIVNDELPIEAQLGLQSLDQPDAAVIQRIVELLSDEASNRLMVTRIGQLAVGDCGNAPNEMFAGYAAQKPIAISKTDALAIADKLAATLETVVAGQGMEIDPQRIAEEIGRLAAMTRVNSKNLQLKMVELIARDQSTAQQDIHWLNCLSQIIDDRQNRLSEELEPVVASALVRLTKKIQRDHQEIDRNFPIRLKSLTERLCRRIGVEFSLMVATKLDGTDDQVYLYEALAGPAKDAAIDQFANRVEVDPDSVTAGQLAVLGSHSGGIYAPLIRRFSRRPEFRDVAIECLSKSPKPTDRLLFVDGLASPSLPTIRNSAIGLRRIFDTPRPDEIVAALKAMLRLSWDKPSSGVRDQLVLLLEKHTDQTFQYQPNKNKLVQAEMLNRWEQFVATEHPALFAAAFANEDVRGLSDRLASVPWDSGDSVRGERVYKTLQCAQCHDSGSRLGPRLGGIANRFSRADIFRAIVLPNEQVPDRYRALLIETVDGQFFRGTMIYESVDGITLQESGGNTIRVNRLDIETRTVSPKSLMPEGLLNDASDQDWADLYSYLAK